MNFVAHYFWIILAGIVMGIAISRLWGRPRPEKARPIADPPIPAADIASLDRINELIEQERSRIATELHDELGTLLSVIHLDLELLLRESASLTPHGESRLLEVRKNLNLVIESIRHNIWSLAPQMLEDVQLDFAVRELCRKLDAYKGTHLHFVQSGVSFALAHKEKLNLFRIVQELLTNAIKHSGAWNISVHMDWDSDFLTIVVEDDGSSSGGHEPATGSGGMGTANVLKRANVIGATLVRETLTRGMRVTIKLKKGTGAEPSAGTSA